MQYDLFMWRYWGPIVILILYFDFFLLNVSAEKSWLLHNFCLQQTPANSEFRVLYQALVCGANPPAELFFSKFQTMGLYHLVVVSGSHLLFLEGLFLIIFSISKNMTKKLTSRFLPSQTVKSFNPQLIVVGQVLLCVMLYIFVVACRLQPPILRSFLFLILRKSNEDAKTHCPADILCGTAGIIGLTLFPRWISSMSFLLSWLAGLALTVKIKNSGLTICALAFLFLFPVMLLVQNQHPFTIFFNFLLSPVIGLLLFPLSLLVVVFPKAYVLIDPLWRMFIDIINTIPFQPTTAPPIDRQNYYVALIWIYVAAIHWMLIHRRLRQRRCR